MANLPITPLSPNQPAPGSFTLVNTNFAALDAAQASITSRALNAPPNSPALNAAYIVAASPTGAWANKASAIASWNGGSWDFYTPFTGQLKHIIGENMLSVYWNGTAWVEGGGGGGSADPAILFPLIVVSNGDVVTANGEIVWSY